MMRALVFLLLAASSGLSIAKDDWVSPIDAKYKIKSPDLYREFDQARSILDSWRGEGEKLSKAQQLLAEIIKRDTTYAPAYLEFGRLYIMAGYINRQNYDVGSLSPAEAAIQKSIEIEPNYADAYVLLGHLYTNLKQYDQARNALEKGEYLGTKNPWLQLNWADLLEREDSWDGAAKRYISVVDRGTTNKKAYAAALEGLISYYVHKGDIAAADRWYQKAVAYEPSSAWSWGNYASFLLFRRNDIDGSIKAGEKALSIMDYGMGRFTLACALYTKWALAKQSNGSAKDAQVIFERAYLLYPDIDEVISETSKHESTRVTASQLTMHRKFFPAGR